MIPAGVTLGAGRRLPVSQRGYFTVGPDGKRHYTACMFAGESQLLERRGYRLPLKRQKPAPGAPDNFVHQLQQAGDPTPLNGSTIRQGQVALKKLFGDDLPDIKYGALTDDELIAELGKNASIRVSVDCGKLPAKLKRWVGQSFTGRHAITLDALGNGPVGPVVARTDPMYVPARDIRAQWTEYAALKPALVRTAGGKVIVTLAYQGDMTATPGPTPPVDECAELRAQLAAAQEQNVALEMHLEELELAGDAMAAAIDAADEQAEGWRDLRNPGS